MPLKVLGDRVARGSRFKPGLFKKQKDSQYGWDVLREGGREEEVRDEFRDSNSWLSTATPSQKGLPAIKDYCPWRTSAPGDRTHGWGCISWALAERQWCPPAGSCENTLIKGLSMQVCAGKSQAGGDL